MQLQNLVRLIEALGAECARVGRSRNRLSGASHATAGARHHFDQVVLALARPHLFGDDTSIAQSVDDGQLEFRAVDIDGGLAQAGIAAHLLEFNLLQLLASHLLRGIAQNGLGDAA